MLSPEHMGGFYAPVDTTGGGANGPIDSKISQLNPPVEHPLFEQQQTSLDASKPPTGISSTEVDRGPEQRTWEEKFMKDFVRKLRASPRQGLFGVKEEEIAQKIEAAGHVFEKIEMAREGEGEPIGLHYLELYFRMSYPEFDEERINKELDFIRKDTEWMKRLANPAVEKDFTQPGWREPDSHI